MVEASVVCLRNNLDVFQRNLGSSKFLQNRDVVIVENAKSAGSGLNWGIMQAVNDLIVMVHQDVWLPDSWEMDFEIALARLDSRRWGIAGAAGMTENLRLRGWIQDRGRTWGRPSSERVEEVAVLDELLLVIRKSSGLRFDERLLGWHLYGMDICRKAASASLPCFAMQTWLHHNSSLRRGDGNGLARDSELLCNLMYLYSREPDLPIVALSLPRDLMKTSRRM